MNYKVDLEPLYDKLKDEFKNNASSNKVTDLLEEIYRVTFDFLCSCKTKALISKVDGKDYYRFSYNNQYTRAINAALFAEGKIVSNYSVGANSYSGKPADYLFYNIRNSDIKNQDAHSITVAVYSIAICFCATIDVLKTSDQKTPGTYFEILMGHFYALTFKVNPRKQLEVLNLGDHPTLPTDFIFDLGDGRAKYHVPVKTSTRERVVQVWSHQKVLDGVYGMGRFLGLLTCLAETNVNNKRNDVVEVCLPDQWQIYQSFIAQLKRVYYLDIPNKYKALNNNFPKIHVKEFGEFFFEIDELCE